MIDKNFKALMSNFQAFWDQDVNIRLNYLKTLLTNPELNSNFSLVFYAYNLYLKSYNSLITSIDTAKQKLQFTKEQQESLENFKDIIATENLHLTIVCMSYTSPSDPPENDQTGSTSAAPFK